MAKKKPSRLARWLAAKASYNYCGVCGHVPQTSKDEPNRGPLRWWDCDDGWRIGTLCRHCADGEGVLDDQPEPEDYAYAAHAGDACSGEPETDEDPMLAF